LTGSPGWVLAGRPAATALFLGGDMVSRGPRGSVNSSEVCMLRERSFQELPLAVSPGRRLARRNAVTPARLDSTLKLFLGRGNFCWDFRGEFVFVLSQFSSVFCFLHLLVSKVSSILVHIETNGPFDQSASKKNTSRFGNQHGWWFREISSDSFVVIRGEVPFRGRASPGGS